MADIGPIRTVLMTAFRPMPRWLSRRYISDAAQAIDKMSEVAERIKETSRDAVIDNVAEER